MIIIIKEAHTELKHEVISYQLCNFGQIFSYKFLSATVPTVMPSPELLDSASEFILHQLSHDPWHVWAIQLMNK